MGFLTLEPFKVPGGLVLTRRTAGSYTNGVYTGGTTSTVTLNPVVAYRSTPEETERLPEGQRMSENMTVLTRVAVYGPQDNGAPGDTISYRGVTYLVLNVTRWDQHGQYYEAVAARQVGS